MTQGEVIVAPRPVDAPTPENPMADPRFLDPLILEYVDGHTWKVIREFDYHTDVRMVWVVKVPVGFFTDFASVPKLLWNLMPPTGRYGKAAVVHDYLYRTVGIATKNEADEIFLEAMKALGVSAVLRYAMYYGVRFFGGSSYKGGL